MCVGGGGEGSESRPHQCPTAQTAEEEASDSDHTQDSLIRRIGQGIYIAERARCGKCQE